MSVRFFMVNRRRNACAAARVPRLHLLASLALALAGASVARGRADAQIIPAAPVAPVALSYTQVTDLVLKSPVVVDATIRSVRRLKPAQSGTVAAGSARLLVTADVVRLIRGPDVLPGRIEYLLDIPLDTRGRIPRLKKQHVLLFARSVVGQANQLQLNGPDAQQPWTAPLDSLAREVIAALVKPDAPPAITGIGNAFHVTGALPGEGETQIFLTTADRRPVSLSIISRPGELRRWGVSLSEIVDDAARPPAPATLLWYRLACSLPPALPDAALANAAESDAAAARDDYRFVLDSLGPCGERAR